MNLPRLSLQMAKTLAEILTAAFVSDNQHAAKLCPNPLATGNRDNKCLLF